MADFSDIVFRAVIMGVVATAILDLWAVYVWRAYGGPPGKL